MSSKNNVRNYQELGICLQRIANRLMANDDLVNLLYFQDKDPLSHTPLTQEQKEKEIFNKHILITPKIPPQENATSSITIMAMSGEQNRENSEFRNIAITIEVYVPITQWFIKSSNLRPFAIMGAVQESLNQKIINGMGRMVGGDFNYSFTTDEVTCFIMYFEIINYD